MHVNDVHTMEIAASNQPKKVIIDDVEPIWARVPIRAARPWIRHVGADVYTLDPTNL